MEDKDFCNFFHDVMQTHFIDFAVRETDVCAALREIQFAYSRKGQHLSCYLEPLNYNHPAYRCAYLYKYAGFHAAMVNHVLSLYLKHTNIFTRISLNKNDVMNICCLGGGPGTDICGLSKTLSQDLEVEEFRLTTIDAMGGWASVFDTMLELDMTNYGYLYEFFSRIIFDEYISDDLLFPGNDTKKALQSADLVTMIKFVSTVKQYGVKDMLKALFRELKPGALVLFIDNDAGGFREVVYQAATECRLTELCRPFRHIKFGSDVFRNTMFGASRLSYATVTAQVWMANDCSSLPTEITSSNKDYFYPYSTEPLPILIQGGDIEKCFTNPVGTTGQINIQDSIQNEQGMVDPVIEEDSLETNDVSNKTGNFMTEQTSLIPTSQEPSVHHDGMESYFKRYEDSLLTKVHIVDDDTGIEQAQSVEQEAQISREMFLEDFVQEEAREKDFRQKPPAEDSFLKANLGIASLVERNEEIDMCDAYDITGNIPKSSDDSILTITCSRNFPTSTILSCISTPKSKNFLENVQTNQGSHLREKLVNKSFEETICRNGFNMRANYETDYESLSVFVLTLLVYFIFLSYYLK